MRNRHHRHPSGRDAAADKHIDSTDPSGHGRQNPAIRKRDPRHIDRRLIGEEHSLLGFNLRLRQVERALRCEILRKEFLTAPQLALRVRKSRLVALQLCQRALQVGLLISRVEYKQKIALANGIALANFCFNNHAADLGFDFNNLEWRNGSCRFNHYWHVTLGGDHGRHTHRPAAARAGITARRSFFAGIGTARFIGCASLLW